MVWLLPRPSTHSKPHRYELRTHTHTEHTISGELYEGDTLYLAKVNAIGGHRMWNAVGIHTITSRCASIHDSFLCVLFPEMAGSFCVNVVDLPSHARHVTVWVCVCTVHTAFVGSLDNVYIYMVLKIENLRFIFFIVLGAHANVGIFLCNFICCMQYAPFVACLLSTFPCLYYICVYVCEHSMCRPSIKIKYRL